MWQFSMHSIFKVFCLGHWWTPRDELYGIIDHSINPGLGLHEPIGIPELSTLDLEVCIIPIFYSTDYFSMIGRYELQ
jgi:hypothetical protein